MWCRSLAVVGLCWSMVCAVDAAETAEALQAAVTQSANRYTEAFAKQDAQAIAALFTKEAEYIDASGTIFHGRDAIEAELIATFAAGAHGTIDIELISIRPIADGLVVEDGVSTFRAKDNGTSTHTRYTALHLRQSDGSWLMASVRQLDEPTTSAHDRLTSLAWLLGRWREEQSGSVVTSEWAWTEDGNALVSQFSMRDAHDHVKTGTHRVGWDAERKQFRSWIFDATGAFADGWWTLADNDLWSVSLHGVDAEGARVATLLTYARDGADTLVITQDQRTRGGATLPSISSRVVRQPPAPGKDVSSR